VTKTEQEIAGLAKPIVEELGYILYDVMYLKEAGEWYLRFFIDSKEKKIDLDDCEKVSSKLSDMLDEKDPISESYNLEVSSCGLERHLREPSHYIDAIGKKILVKLFTNINGKKEHEGVLNSYNSDYIELLENDNKEVQIALKDISMSKILYNWEELENE